MIGYSLVTWGLAYGCFVVALAVFVGRWLEHRPPHRRVQGFPKSRRRRRGWWWPW